MEILSRLLLAALILVVNNMQTKDRRVLITGSAGNLGQYLCATDFSDGWEVYRTDKDDLDVANYARVESFCEKYRPTAVVHLAGLLSGEAKELENINTLATINLYKAANRWGCEKFIFTSTASVYNQKDMKPTKESENIDPQGDYGKSKMYAEQALLSMESGVLILRVFNIYGLRFENSLWTKLKNSYNGERVVVRNPENFWRDYIHATEVCRFILEGLNRRIMGLYNLATGESKNTMELIGDFEDAGIFPNYEIQDGDASYSFADITNLKRAFGFVPSRSIIYG